MIHIYNTKQSYLENVFESIILKFKSNKIHPKLSNQLESLASSLNESEVKYSFSSLHNPNIHYFHSQKSKFSVEFKRLKYSQIKNLIKSSKIISGLGLQHIIEKKIKYIESDGWIAGLINEEIDSLTLENLIHEYKGFKSEPLPCELIVLVLINLMKIFEEVKDRICNFTIKAKNFVFKPDPEKGFERIYCCVDLLDFETLDQANQLYDNGQEPNRSEFLISVGKLMIRCLTLDSDEHINNSTAESLLLRINQNGYIPGLFKLIHKLIQSPAYYLKSSKSSSNILKTWESLLTHSELPSSPSLASLYSAFYFSSSSIKHNSLSILTQPELSDLTFPIKLIKNQVHKIFFSYLNTLKQIDSKIGQFLFKLLKDLNQDESFKTAENLLSLSYILSKIDYELIDPVVRKDVGKGIKSLAKSKTLTILSFFQRKEIFLKLMLKDDQELAGLIKLSSFIGPDSIDFIEELYRLKFFALGIEAFPLIEHIPPHFKLSRSLQIMNFMDTVLGKSNLPHQHLQFSIIMAFNVVYELLKASKDAKSTNLKGTCYKNKSNYKVAPAMIKCLTCNKTLCIVCGQIHEDSTHRVTYLTYFANIDQTCEGSSIPLPLSNPQLLIPVFKDFNLIHHYENGFLTMYEGTSTTSEPAEHKQGTIEPYLFEFPEMAYYTEFYFESLSSENFDIEIRGTGIVVKNTLEEVVRNGVHVGKMPRIGIFDTFGIGICADNKVFFTYNGFHLRKFIEFKAERVSIKIVFKDFPEDPFVRRLDKNMLFIGESFDYIEKDWAMKYVNIVKNFCMVHKKLKKKHQEIDKEANIYDVVFHIKEFFTVNEITKVFQPNRENKKMFKDCRII